MGSDESFSGREVSLRKEDAFENTEDLGKVLDLKKSFCKILPDIFSGDDEYCNVMSFNSVEVKSYLAYLYWKETGDISVWRGIAQDAAIASIDNLACVGALNNFALTSFIGRNKNTVSGGVIMEIAKGMQSFFSLMNKYDINIYCGSGGISNVIDTVRTIIVNSATTVRMKRSDIVLIDPKPDDVIIGFSSDGQSKYETQYNSGVGNHGLANVYHNIFHKSYSKKYSELVFAGTNHFIEPAYDGLNWGEFMLSSARTYAPLIKKILSCSELKKFIHGFVQNTDGGQTRITDFLSKDLFIKKDFSKMGEISNLFREIQKQTNTSWENMFKTFDIGYRLEAYVDPSIVNPIAGLANELGIDAKVIGYVESKEGRSELAIKSPDGETYVYYPK